MTTTMCYKCNYGYAHPFHDDGTDNRDLMTCGDCERTWDDSVITSMTPAPSARCPFEYFHDGHSVPTATFPVKMVTP